jgi:hypothetical protein
VRAQGEIQGKDGLDEEPKLALHENIGANIGQNSGMIIQ